MVCFHAISKTEIKVSILNYYCHYAFFFLFPKRAFCPLLISLEMSLAFHSSQDNNHLLSDKNYILHKVSEGLCCESSSHIYFAIYLILLLLYTDSELVIKQDILNFFIIIGLNNITYSLFLSWYLFVNIHSLSIKGQITAFFKLSLSCLSENYCFVSVTHPMDYSLFSVIFPGFPKWFSSFFNLLHCDSSCFMFIIVLLVKDFRYLQSLKVWKKYLGPWLLRVYI